MDFLQEGVGGGEFFLAFAAFCGQEGGHGGGHEDGLLGEERDHSPNCQGVFCQMFFRVSFAFPELPTDKAIPNGYGQCAQGLS